MSQKKAAELSFEKFIKDIEKREQIEKGVPEDRNLEEHPGMRRNKLYTEKWQNSIKYGRKK